MSPYVWASVMKSSTEPSPNNPQSLQLPRYTLLEDLTSIPFVAGKGAHRPSSSSREYGRSGFWEQVLKPVKSGFLEGRSGGVE